MPRFGEEVLGKGGNAFVKKCYVPALDGSELTFACKIEGKVLYCYAMLYKLFMACNRNHYVNQSGLKTFVSSAILNTLLLSMPT